jgi:hypothetical protein
MTIKTGSRWRSVVCDTQVVVVRAPSAEVVLECGGVPMVEFEAADSVTGVPAEGFNGGTQMGKRYVDVMHGLEVLCTKGGKGSLSSAGDLLDLKSAKPLPASD